MFDHSKDVGEVGVEALGEVSKYGVAREAVGSILQVEVVRALVRSMTGPPAGFSSASAKRSTDTFSHFTV
jgi:hypothetical protein